MEKPKPTLIETTDAIVRVTMSSICTSDLHIKHGSVPRAVLGVHSYDIDPHSYDVDPLEEGRAFKEQSLFACKQAAA